MYVSLENMLEHVQADSDRYVQESLLQGLGCVFGFIAGYCQERI